MTATESNVLEPAFCGLFPHPPIVVPEVGRERHGECRPTYDACREFARRLVASEPDRLLVVSPHSPRARRAFGLWSGDRLQGNLGRFGAPRAAVDLANDPQAVAALAGAAGAHGVETWTIPSEPLDHGAVIPLWFVQEAGWDGPTSIASLPWSDDPRTMEAFGRTVADAFAPLAGSTALIASGDMTHRALPGAPAGYHPRAVEFDRTLTDLVRQGRLADISAIDPGLRKDAAEDAADTSIIAAAIGFRPRGAEVLSYEHPFGVGYLVAVFHQSPHPPVPSPSPPSHPPGRGGDS
ncbi:MAG: class III extradiol dioxygenase subunit B-like domain-containing protein [Thermoanaerobaculia bacterium]